ncbi:hypothetical protein AB0L06_25265 [Spirillospora sp. NPDC052269]
MKITGMTSYTIDAAAPDQAVSLVGNGDGSMSVFATAGGQIQAARIKPGAAPDGFSPVTVGGKSVAAAGAPVAQRVGDGRVGVFYRDGDGRLMLLGDTKGGPGVWNAPVNPAGALMTGDPILGRNADGRLETYFVGTDGALWHTWTGDAGLESAGCAQFGGGNIRDIAVATTSDGRQVLFHANMSGELWVIQQTGPNGSWGDFSNPITSVTGPLVAAPETTAPLMAVYGANSSGADNVLSFTQQNADLSWTPSAELPYDETARPNTDPAVRPVLLPGPSKLLVAAVVYGGTLWVLEQPADPTVRYGAWTTQVFETAAVDKLIAAAFWGSYLNVVAGSSKAGLTHYQFTFTA